MKRNIFLFTALCCLFWGCNEDTISPPTNVRAEQDQNMVHVTWSGSVGVHYEIVINNTKWMKLYDTFFYHTDPTEGKNTYEITAVDGAKHSRPVTVICYYSPQGGSGNNGGGSNSGNQTSEYAKEMQKKLIGTTWTLTQSLLGTTSFPHHATVSFLSDTRVYFSNVYADFGREHDLDYIINCESTWWFTDNDEIFLNSFFTINNTVYNVPNLTLTDATLSGGLDAVCCGRYKIAYITDYEMKMTRGDEIKVYKKGASSGMGQSLEFTNFDATSYTTSITVDFYTSQKAKSATIYYGKYSASTKASTTIVNKKITATIKNLERGTKYYVKCVATGDGGTVTSETFPVMTNY